MFFITSLLVLNCPNKPYKANTIYRPLEGSAVIYIVSIQVDKSFRISKNQVHLPIGTSIHQNASFWFDQYQS